MIAFSVELRQGCHRVFSLRQVGTGLIMSIGLALATIMFAVGYGYSSRSLPYKDAEQLVAIGRMPINARSPYLYPDAERFFEWKGRKDVFTDIAGCWTHGGGWKVRTRRGNITVHGVDVTDNFFDLLGLSFPGINEWKRGVGTRNPDPVVLTHRLGVNTFGYSAIGQLFRTIDGAGIAVNGILPSEFMLPRETLAGNTPDCALTPVIMEREHSGGLMVIGRLAPGITPQIAEQTIGPRSDENAVLWGRIVVRPLLAVMTESSLPIVWGSWALCGLVLVLCSANLSGILLVRCTYRLREYATRTALGAGLLHLLRLLLIELTVLSMISAAIAWTIGRASIARIGDVMPVRYLAFGRPVWGWEAAVFLIAATIVVVSLSAASTIVVMARRHRNGFSRGLWTVFYSHRVVRTLLTAGQTAIAMLLLSLSYMTVRGYLDMVNHDLGLDASVRVTSVLHSSRLSDSAMKSIALNILDTLRGGDPSAPVGVCMGTLFNDVTAHSNLVSPKTGQSQMAGAMSVSPGFFNALKARILAGREFNDRDRDGVILLNASLARKMGWRPVEAVGQPVQLPTGRTASIIGVVNDFLTTTWDGDVLSTVFHPLELSSAISVNYIVHSDALSRAGNIERAILQSDPDAIITRNSRWSELLGASVRGRTFATFSVVLFTVVAIAIVATGIVSTVMFIIARRMRELAVHIAVGATSGHVCWSVMRDMVVAGMGGILIGGLASWWAGRTAAHFTYHGDRYLSPLGLVLMAVVMIAVIAVVSLMPALRALRIEPIRALSAE